jgi:hypothetical protein
VTRIIELYEDRQSAWRVLSSRGGTIGYRFMIVERAGRSTFAADAMELARGGVPAGLEQVDLDVDSPHGMVLIEPCALWSRGRVRRTATKPGVLTAAYISGELNLEASAGTREQPPAEQRTVVLRVQSGGGGHQLVAPAGRAMRPLPGEDSLGTLHGGVGCTTGDNRQRRDLDASEAQPHVVVVRIGNPQSLEAGLLPRGVARMSETILADKALVPVSPLRGQLMPRTSSNGSTTRRRRRTAAGPDTRLVVSQITELVAANEQLQRANSELTEENQRLRGELTAIGSALGSLTGGRRGRGRGAATALALPEAKPRRQRRPITDPEVLARRNAALAKARAARADKLAAARAAVSAG